MEVLQTAAELHSTSALLSDLSAAYLALSEDGQPWLHIDAIAAAQRAVELGPSDPQAAFNLALALEKLSLVHEAGLAWERYLQIKDDKDWHQEAVTRLASLRKPTARERWEREKGALLEAAAKHDVVALRHAAREFSEPLRDLLERKLLPEVEQSLGTDAEGERYFTARNVAEAVAASGEPLYLDAIDALYRSRRGRRLAPGSPLHEFAEGLALRDDCSLATPHFERSLAPLATTSNPMALAARYQYLVCLYRSDPSDALSQLQDLASVLDRLRYPTLLAKVEAMRGLCTTASGRYADAIALYREALRQLEKVGERHVFGYQGMLDECFRLLGDRSAAWSYRLSALAGATRAGDRRYTHSVLSGLARELAGEGRRGVAITVIDEMLANARAWREAGAEAMALLRRIQLLGQTGDDLQVSQDLADCALRLQEFPQRGDRQRLETELLVASAEYALISQPAAAQTKGLAAVSQAESSQDVLLLPRALLAYAQAEAALGHASTAQGAFDRALQILEDQRGESRSEALRISFFSTAQPAFDAMIRFQALGLGDSQAAFLSAERVRARALRERLASRQRSVNPESLRTQLSHIPAGVVVLAFSVLPDRLLVWRLTRSDFAMIPLPLGRGRVRALVQKVTATLRTEGPRLTRWKVLAGAYDALLRLPLAAVPNGAEIVFLLDRELYQLPFAALFDSTRRRFLFQDHASSVAPSLDTYLASLGIPNFKDLPPKGVLAIGDPAFDAGTFPKLRPLSAARREARALGFLYKHSQVLLGEDASRENILASLRGQDVLDLAAHVVVDSHRPLESIVVTAGPRRHALRASELAAAGLTGTRLVVLAACDTAPGFSDGDREGVSGLARAFLAAGVPFVVATLWSTRDSSAARFSWHFHRCLLRGMSPAEALRQAQIALFSATRSLRDSGASFQLFRAAKSG